MLSKTTLFFVLLRLATVALLLYFSVHILANKGSEKEGVVRVSVRRQVPTVCYEALMASS